jgi:hypothetical protein
MSTTRWKVTCFVVLLLCGCGRPKPREEAEKPLPPPTPEALYQISHGIAACLPPFPELEKGDVVASENTPHTFYVISKDGVDTRSGRRVYELIKATQDKITAWFQDRDAKSIPYWCDVIGPAF